jgi:hypothetical protein
MAAHASVVTPARIEGVICANYRRRATFDTLERAQSVRETEGRSHPHPLCSPRRLSRSDS